jgi:hypothetical protein
VGVPWQDIARCNAGGDPDLDSGLDGSGNPVGGLQSAAELVALGTWDVILGDPASYVAPTDPLMIESRGPRSGTNPITGDALAPPGSGTLANPINGHEYGDPSQEDLQYACIFELPEARDCSAMQTSCECEVISDSLLCQDPADAERRSPRRSRRRPTDRRGGRASSSPPWWRRANRRARARASSPKRSVELFQASEPAGVVVFRGDPGYHLRSGVSEVAA